MWHGVAAAMTASATATTWIHGDIENHRHGGVNQAANNQKA